MMPQKPKEDVSWKVNVIRCVLPPPRILFQVYQRSGCALGVKALVNFLVTDKSEEDSKKQRALRDVRRMRVPSIPWQEMNCSKCLSFCVSTSPLHWLTTCVPLSNSNLLVFAGGGGYKMNMAQRWKRGTST